MDIRSIEEKFIGARGDRRDGVWVRAAYTELRSHGVEADEAMSAVNDLTSLLSSAGESAESLYGDARGWAKANIVENKRAPESGDGGLVDVAVAAAIFAAVFSVFTAVVVWITDDGELNVARAFVVPIAIGIGFAGIPAVFRGFLGRFSFRIAAVAAVLAFLGYLGVIMLVFPMLSALFEVQTTALVVLGAAAFWVGLAYVLRRHIRPLVMVRPHGAADALSDEEWIAEAAAGLRLRGDFSDARVEDYLAEARSHADAGESTLVEEFGPPARYAQSLAPQRGVRARREGLFSLAGILFPVILIVMHVVTKGWTWDAYLVWPVLMFLTFGIGALLQFRSAR